MPAKFESDPEMVMALAFSLKINQKKMKKMEKEYMTMKTKEKEDEIELRVRIWVVSPISVAELSETPWRFVNLLVNVVHKNPTWTNVKN